MSNRRFSKILEGLPPRILTELVLVSPLTTISAASTSVESPLSLSPSTSTFYANEIQITIEKFPGTASIFIGSVVDSQSFEVLQMQGITHILNVAYECDFYESVLKGNIVTKKIPLRDTAEQDLLSIIDEAYNFINECIQGGGKILIHCFAGVSRSVSVVIGYLIMREIRKSTLLNFSSINNQNNTIYKKIYKRVSSIRQESMPNFGFCCQLMELEKKELRNHALFLNIPTHNTHHEQTDINKHILNEKKCTCSTTEMRDKSKEENKDAV
jgi:hypothetical protein